MKAEIYYSSKKRRIAVIALAVVFLAITLALNVMNRGGSQVIILGAASLSGVLTAIQSLIVLAMVVVDYRLGGKLASILLIITITTNLLIIFAAHNTSVVPGLCYNIAIYIAVHIIKRGLRNETRNALIDELTGISNRRHILSYIDELIAVRKPFYAIYLDLNHFKYINDTEGHERGDQVLKKIADLWKAVDPKNAMLARLGGDEFLVIVPEEICEDPVEYANRYAKAVSDYLNPNGKTALYVTVIGGVSNYPLDGQTASEIIRKADIAMYAVKNSGRNVICRYEASFEADLLKDQLIEGRVRQALDEKLFFMVYQPQYDAFTKKLRGFESLIRMKSGSEAPISPGEFIPVAEKSDFIIEIGEFVLKSAMSDFASIVAANPEIVLSINISPKQLLSRDFVNIVMKTLDDTGFRAGNLELEITEYCLMDSTEDAIAVINSLKELGVQIAMDDFGTGYSSLSYLTRMPIDLLKIDKSIVDTMGEGEIIGAISSMGHALGCKIIAEGVETEDQLEILRERKVDHIQGYLWGRPMSLESIGEML